MKKEKLLMLRWLKVTKRKRVESEREEEKTEILDDENAEACEALMVPDALVEKLKEGGFKF
jgi:hypothetical protein